MHPRYSFVYRSPVLGSALRCSARRTFETVTTLLSGITAGADVARRPLAEALPRGCTDIACHFLPIAVRDPATIKLFAYAREVMNGRKSLGFHTPCERYSIAAELSIRSSR
jgi:hypothetical protein